MRGMKEQQQDELSETRSTAVELVSGKAAFSVDEFCELFGISRRLTYNQINAGRLKIRKVGRRTLIRACDARAWLDALPEG